MRVKTAFLSPVLGLLAMAAPLFAHHAFAVEFDAKKQVTLFGVVTKVDWSNPHTYFYVNVKEESGSLVNWTFETAGPNTLAKLGWDRNSLKVGDKVTVTAYRARGASNIASARSVVLADGRKVSAGSPVDGGPQH